FAGLGHAVRKLPVRHDMRWFQAARRADLAFNLCEGVHGGSEWEEHVVATLEFAGIPVTGASTWTLAACRRKAIANAILSPAGSSTSDSSESARCPSRRSISRGCRPGAGRS